MAFNIISSDNEASNLASYLAGLNPKGGTANVDGQDYTFLNFESFLVKRVLFTEGPTRLYDYGVTSGIASAGGQRCLDAKLAGRADHAVVVIPHFPQAAFAGGFGGEALARPTTPNGRVPDSTHDPQEVF